MKCELRDVKIHDDMSEGTTCFSATLYIDGKKAATVKNDGRGGCNMYYFADRELEDAFEAYCESLPPMPASDGFPELSMDSDLYISELLDRFEAGK